MSDNEIELDQLEDNKLTDWVNEPSLSQLKRDYEEVKPSHASQKTRIDKWLDNLYVRDSAIPKVNKGKSAIVPKLIRKQAEWRYSSLTEPFISTRDLITVEPVTFEDTKGAELSSVLLNHYYNHAIDKVSFIDEYIRTAVDEGTVILRTGWKVEREEVTELVTQYELIPTSNQETIELLEAASVMEMESPTDYIQQVTGGLLAAHNEYKATGVPCDFSEIGVEEVTTLKTVKNHPTVEICDFDDVFIDPSCNGDISKANFVIYKFVSSKSDLEKQGIYSNLDKIQINSKELSEPDDAFTSDPNFTFADKPRSLFTVFEYWGYYDIDGSGVTKPIVATWVRDTLIRLEENPYPDKELPFIVVPYLPVRKHIYGEPDGALLEDNQKILGAVTRGMIDILAKSANAQTGFRKGALDPLNFKKFTEGSDYEFNPIGSPVDSIYMHKFSEIPASAQYLHELQNMEAESLTAIKTYSGGINSSSLGEVASGIRGALDASSKRELAILRRLANGIVQVSRKWLAMAAAFLDEEEIVRITNERFVAIRADDIGGRYDLSLTISTAEEDAAKSQQLVFMLQTMGNSIPFDMTKLILKEIARLQKMPELAKLIEDFSPQPDPHVQAMQQLELMKAQMEIEKIQAEINNLHSNAAKNMASAEKEASAAVLNQAKADNATLDFVEQESGVKQERDLQKLGAQAEANIKLEEAKQRLATYNAANSLNS